MAKKPFLHLVTSQIKLIFGLDILEVSLEQLRQILDQTFDKKSQFENDYLDAEIYQLFGDFELWIIYIPIDYRIDIIYGNAVLKDDL